VGFADGIDNIGVNHTDDLTGTGVRLNPLGINTDSMQRRVTTVCSPGTAIRLIGPTGASICSQGGFAVGKFRDADTDLPGSPAKLTILSTTLPAGSWLVMAKVIPYGFQNSKWGVTCQLTTGRDFDTSSTGTSGQTFNTPMQLSLMVLRASGSPFPAALTCGESYGNAVVTWAKLIALQLDSFTNSPQS
jgi:hypothetical protein